MKKYNIDNLRVVKIQTKNDVRYTICYYSKLFRTYTDVFTEQKNIPTSPVEVLTKYYNCAELYDRRNNGKLYIKRKEVKNKIDSKPYIQSTHTSQSKNPNKGVAQNNN